MTKSDGRSSFSIAPFLFGVAAATTIAFFYAVFFRSIPPVAAATILACVFFLEVLSGLAVWVAKHPDDHH
jgi:hypothetical protein